MKILSIDAWGNKEDGYEWNSWYPIGEIDKDIFDELNNDIDIINYLINEGYLRESARELAETFDDGYNIVIQDKNTLEPVFAIEYGTECY